jgi:hypothetical protein
MKEYLYPDGKIRNKSLNELSPEEAEVAMIPRHMSASEIRKWEWAQQKATIKAILLIPWELSIILLTALVLLPDEIVRRWKENK